MDKTDAAERIAKLMQPGHPVRRRAVEDAGLPPGWALEISRASRGAADGTAGLLAAHDLADRLTTTGKARAALALRSVVRGSDRRPPRDENPEARTARITRRLEGIDGVGNRRLPPRRRTTMKNYSRSIRYRIHRGRSILDRLHGLGITPPAEVAAAAAHLAALEARRRALPDETAARAATVAALDADPDADIRDLALNECARDIELLALAQALDRAAENLSAAVMANADDIVATVRADVFDPAVKTLTAVARLPAGTSLADLVRAKANKDAAAWTEAPLAAERLKMAYTLRDGLYRGETAGMPHRTWRNPDAIDWAGHESTTGRDRYVHGIRQGGELWLAGYTELEDLAREADRARRAQRQAQHAAA